MYRTKQDKVDYEPWKIICNWTRNVIPTKDNFEEMIISVSNGAAYSKDFFAKPAHHTCFVAWKRKIFARTSLTFLPPSTCIDYNNALVIISNQMKTCLLCFSRNFFYSKYFSTTKITIYKQTQHQYSGENLIILTFQKWIQCKELHLLWFFFLEFWKSDLKWLMWHHLQFFD